MEIETGPFAKKLGHISDGQFRLRLFVWKGCEWNAENAFILQYNSTPMLTWLLQSEEVWFLRGQWPRHLTQL